MPTIDPALALESSTQLERLKFTTNADGEVVVRTSGTIIGANGEDLTTIIDGNGYLNLISLWPLLAVDNNILATYPSSTQELYNFRRGSTSVLQLQVDYTDSSKTVFSEARRIA